MRDQRVRGSKCALAHRNRLCDCPVPHGQGMRDRDVEDRRLGPGTHNSSNAPDFLEESFLSNRSRQASITGAGGVLRFVRGDGRQRFEGRFGLRDPVAGRFELVQVNEQIARRADILDACPRMVDDWLRNRSAVAKLIDAKSAIPEQHR